MAATRNGRHHLIGGLTWFFGLLVLLAPGRALADDILVDAVGNTDGVVAETGDALADAENETTEAADTVSDVTETANGATEAADEGAGEVTTAAGNSVNDANETTQEATNSVTEAVGQAGDQAENTANVVTEAAGGVVDDAETTANDVTEAADPSKAITGIAGGNSDSDADRRPAGESVSGGGRDGKDRPGSSIAAREASDSGLRQWEPVNPLGWALTGTSSGVLFEQSADSVAARESDPCEDDPQLVCLGLLYGDKESANHGADVLGIVATTGIGVIGLMLLALGLSIGGSGSLVAARGRSAVAAGRAG